MLIILTLITVFLYSCNKEADVKKPIASYMVNSNLDSFFVELQANSINQRTQVTDGKFVYEVPVSYGSKYILSVEGSGVYQGRMYLDGILIETQIKQGKIDLIGNF